MLYSSKLCNILLVICMFLEVFANVNAQPCVSYISVNDACLKTSFLRTQPGSQNCSGTHIPGVWLKYTASKDGVLSTNCPDPNVCSTSRRIWMKDKVPDQVSVTAMVDLCITSPVSCCSQRNRMEMINCGEFVVYRFNRTLPPGVNFCFNATHTGLSTTVAMTSTRTQTTTKLSTARRPISTDVHTTAQSTSVSVSIHTGIKGSNLSNLETGEDRQNDRTGLRTAVIILGISTAILAIFCSIFLYMFGHKRLKEMFNRVFKHRVGSKVYTDTKTEKTCNQDTVARTFFNTNSLN